MTTIVGYKVSETQTLKGYWNGKNYNGTIYMNLLNEETMVIDFKNSVKLPYDLSRMSKMVKSTEKYNASKVTTDHLPTNVNDWMRLMEKSEK
jgi:hypothetical protein